MNVEAIFFLQFGLSLVIWAVVGRIFVLPELSQLSRSRVLMWLLLPHAFRHIGMVFLVPGVVAETMPEGFASAAAYGDLAAGILALFSLVALRMKWKSSISFVWVFSVVGSLDLANALAHAEAIPHMGSAWFVPTILVPLLLITHAHIFIALLRKREGV